MNKLKQGLRLLISVPLLLSNTDPVFINIYEYNNVC